MCLLVSFLKVFANAYYHTVLDFVQITETLKRWGISDSSTGLVAAIFDATPTEVRGVSYVRVSACIASRSG